MPWCHRRNGTLSPRRLTCIDLFCGCGGFTLGMQRAGFDVLAAVDFDAVATQTLGANLTSPPSAANLRPVSKVLQRDLTTYDPKELSSEIGGVSVDVVVGGPPCQGFSNARKVDGSNHGSRLKMDDSRRLLYRDFLRFVEHFQPAVFVMENVLGIRTAVGGAYFTQVQKEARTLGRRHGKPGYRVHGQIEDAWELGVPQKRRRQLIVGVRNDIPGFFPSVLVPPPRRPTQVPLGAAIMDLPPLEAGEGEDERCYDHTLLKSHLENPDYGKQARAYQKHVLQVRLASKLTNHVARPHSKRDLRDFLLIPEGGSSATVMREKGDVFEYPYSRSSFKDRYTRQSRRGPCSTIVAHLSKDGLMFIHPTQNRSLTPREAARIQSFPDWFRFPKARTHSFRLIGNAVPPLIGEALGLAVRDFLDCAWVARDALEGDSRMIPAEPVPESIPRSAVDAAVVLERHIGLDRKALSRLPDDEFLRVWHAFLFLFPGLHPDNALDHGDETEECDVGEPSLRRLATKLRAVYVRSGWPVALEPLGDDAWRRYEDGSVTDDAFFCVEAQRAGIGCSRVDRNCFGARVG